MNIVSPKYLMTLIKNIHDAIWSEYSSYKQARLYVDKWHVETEYDWNHWDENFKIIKKDNGEIDLFSTLHGIKDNDLLLQMAVDLGVETPDFIPSVATFRNEIKAEYKTASATFEKAFKEIETHPDVAIGLANSALESVVKEILKDTRITTEWKQNDTLYELVRSLLKEFKLAPELDIPPEIKTIGGSLLALNTGIEKLRSGSTTFHGKTDEDYLIDDPIYTYFIVNSVSTVGLFLNGYYKSKFLKTFETEIKVPDLDEDNLPF